MDKYFIVKINGNVGLFAQLTWCLEILCYCKEYNRIPYFICTSPLYVDQKKGDNWLDYYFGYKKLSAEDKKAIDQIIKEDRVKTIRHIRELKLHRNYNKVLNIKLAHDLFNEYIAIKSHILKKVDDFCNMNLASRKVLGAHFRGNEMFEAPRLSYDFMKRKIKDFLGEHREYDAIFAASDERDFIKSLKADFSGIEVCSYPATQIADRGKAAHYCINDDNYLKGEEAIIESLILARCNLLIKSSSQLSAWSKIFNPNLRVLVVSKQYAPYMWFPHNEIYKISERSALRRVIAVCKEPFLKAFDIIKPK